MSSTSDSILWNISWCLISNKKNSIQPLEELSSIAGVAGFRLPAHLRAVSRLLHLGCNSSEKTPRPNAEDKFLHTFVMVIEIWFFTELVGKLHVWASTVSPKLHPRVAFLVGLHAITSSFLQYPSYIQSFAILDLMWAFFSKLRSSHLQR